MSVKNLLVAYNGSDGSASALEYALRLGEKYDAHVTGILTHGMSAVLASLGPWATGDVFEIVQKNDETLRDDIRDRFTQATAGAYRPDRVHFLDVAGHPDEALMEAARVFDMIVIGKSEDSPETPHFAPHPDIVALESGRPVVMVPAGYHAHTVVERALLAWDGRRAAARALSDAMALLESSVAVTVLTIGTGPAAERAEGRDVVSHLERHGVSVDWRNVANPPAGIAKCILDIADETAAGMLVMGAYEHSKFSEDLLGGVTNTVFRDAKVPILTAH